MPMSIWVEIGRDIAQTGAAVGVSCVANRRSRCAETMRCGSAAVARLRFAQPHSHHVTYATLVAFNGKLNLIEP